MLTFIVHCLKTACYIHVNSEKLVISGLVLNKYEFGYFYSFGK